MGVVVICWKNFPNLVIAVVKMNSVAEVAMSWDGRGEWVISGMWMARNRLLLAMAAIRQRTGTDRCRLPLASLVLRWVIAELACQLWYQLLRPIMTLQQRLRTLSVVAGVSTKYLRSLTYRTTRRQTNSPTNQLAVSPVADWITRGLVNSPTANFFFLFCWISDRSMVAHLNYTDTNHGITILYLYVKPNPNHNCNTIEYRQHIIV